jgi:hypothetical protein
VILRAIGRLILVPLGLVLGAVAALFTLLTLGIEVTTHALSNGDFDGQRLELIVDGVIRFAHVAASATIVPALLVVIVGEVARIRSALYYIAGGGLALAALPMLAQWTTLGSSSPMTGRAWAVWVTAGFLGGLVYWLVAGRRA